MRVAQAMCQYSSILCEWLLWESSVGLTQRSKSMVFFVVSDGCMVLVENERNDQPQVGRLNKDNRSLIVCAHAHLGQACAVDEWIMICFSM